MDVTFTSNGRGYPDSVEKLVLVLISKCSRKDVIGEKQLGIIKSFAEVL